MLSKIRFISMVVSLSFVLSVAANAKTLYETDFSKGTKDWDLIAKGGEIKLDKDNTAPVHGPNVLIMDDTTASNDNPTLAYIKDLIFADGIILVLWRDGRLPEDTDGPITGIKPIVVMIYAKQIDGHSYIPCSPVVLRGFNTEIIGVDSTSGWRRQISGSF